IPNHSCGICAPEELTCPLSPFPPPANGPPQATLTFQSTAASQSPANPRPDLRLIARDMPRSLVFVIISMLAVLALAQHRKDHWRSFFLRAVLIVVLFRIVSCGGGGGGGSSQGGGGNRQSRHPGGSPHGA